MKSYLFSLLIIFGCALSLLNLTACATSYSQSQLSLIPERDYFSSLSKATQKSQIYDGFQALLDVSATLMSTQVARGQLDHRARMYQWTQDQYSNELAALETQQSKSTVFFLSFFTPERKHDNLHRPRTLWKVFLDVNGKRYEGKVEKIKGVLAETQSLYPFHNRWSTPYKVSFDLPTLSAEAGQIVLTLTGPVGATRLTFQ